MASNKRDKKRNPVAPIAGTPLRLQRTVLTVLGGGFVAIEKVSRLVWVPSFIAQVLVSRADGRGRPALPRSGFIDG
jgi:hypothetical protein